MTILKTILIGAIAMITLPLWVPLLILFFVGENVLYILGEPDHW
jgi:hypothetical protein